jgi:hypothetical protein
MNIEPYVRQYYTVSYINRSFLVADLQANLSRLNT